MESNHVPPGGADPVAARTAIVVAGEEETRVLLRGLLRLHHHRVVGESDGVTVALELLKAHRPAIAIIDSQLTEGAASQFVAEAKRLGGTTRVILLAHGSASAEATPPPPADAILRRPFRIQEFAEALEGPTVPAAPV